MTNTKPAEPTQIDKFRATARELETDQSEEAFDRMVKKISRVPEPKDDKPKKTAKKDTRITKE